MSERSSRARWRAAVTRLRREVRVLAVAMRDERTPWPAKLVMACVVAYAASPIDLVPDVIPVLGLLDDLVLVPLGVLLAIRLLPPSVLEDARARADDVQLGRGGMVAAAVIVALWVVCIVAGAELVLRALA